MVRWKVPFIASHVPLVPLVHTKPTADPQNVTYSVCSFIKPFLRGSADSVFSLRIDMEL
jgi:hypothetical protein